MSSEIGHFDLKQSLLIHKLSGADRTDFLKPFEALIKKLNDEDDNDDNDNDDDEDEDEDEDKDKDKDNDDDDDEEN